MNPRTRSLALAAASAFSLFIVLLRFTQRVASQVQTDGLVISEVAWAGTSYSANDEWIELYNSGTTAVDLDGWMVSDSSGDVAIALQGFVAPGEFFLLERTADDTVSDVPADQVYTGALHNDGETLYLTDDLGAVVDTANGDGGSWPGGHASPDYLSMERVSPTAADEAAGWISSDGLTINGTDAGGNPINGTPRAANAAWGSVPENLPDLVVTLGAPATAIAGEFITYGLRVSNDGTAVATELMLTATLPSGVVYESDDSGLTTDLSDPGKPLWTANALDVDGVLSFTLTASVAPTVAGTIVTHLTASSSDVELQYGNNHTQAESTVLPAHIGPVLINALLYDGYELDDADEAVQLRYTGAASVALGGWTLADGSTSATLDDGLVVGSGQSIWLARDAQAFARQFGFSPDALLSPWPGFANDGDEVVLRSSDGELVDVLVYKGGNVATTGWQGQAVWPYRVSGLFAEEGQLLFRRLDEATGYPVSDTDRADDWAQTNWDPIRGRKVQYPGWSVDRFFQPVTVTAAGTLTIAVAPDNAFMAVVRQIEAAQITIQIETLTLENVALGAALQDAAERGVSVTVLLEGSPAGGIDDGQRYICQQLEEAGGACWYMIRDEDLRIHDRYRYLHAKFMIVDGERAVISSENLSPNSLPDDDKSEGTWGRRGVLLVTSATDVVHRLSQLFEDDLDPAAHQDLFRWQATHADYGAPPEGYEPITLTGGTTYTVRYPLPVTFDDATYMSLSHAPENVLRSSDGLLGLLQSAGAGDTVLVQQLVERSHWGPTLSNPVDDPNPRLEAYIDAARRGATVRILLDSFFDTADDPLSNAATCRYLRQVAAIEHLRLRCALANPTGLGIHNKMVLLHVAGKGWVHVGSWNGTEQSTKGNREIAVMLQSDGTYDYLAALFESDWPHMNWLPLTVFGFHGPKDYPLISELLYDPSGPDDAEFIEISNPTPDLLDLSGWSVSDAVTPADFEDLRRFPQGTLLQPRESLVVALSAVSFESQFAFLPDFEILESRSDVPDMLDDPLWGDPAAILQLGNGGDEVLLRSPPGAVVDAVVYGVGVFPGVVGCPLVEAAGYSLERLPYWQDSNDCSRDFRSWPFPSPGQLP